MPPGALLWTVEATLALAPAQADALAAACAGPNWGAEAFPQPTAAERREPATDRPSAGLLAAPHVG